MAGEESSPGGLFQALRRVIDSAVTAVRQRLDLFAAEIKQEKRNLARVIAQAVAGALLAVFGLVGLTAAIILSLPRDQQLTALWIATGVYLLAALILGGKLLAHLRGHRPFGHTLEQLQKDRETFGRRR